MPIFKLYPCHTIKMPAELRKRKEKAPPAKAEEMPPAKKAAKAAPAPKRKGEFDHHCRARPRIEADTPSL